MPQTHSHIVFHVIHSTKDREDLITPAIMPRLCAYVGGVAREHKAVLLAAGGMRDHLHSLLSVRPTTCPADLVRDIKANSSRWLKTALRSPFAWQAGYGIFSVSASGVANVRRYIANQATHHRRMSFKEEYIAFLEKHGVEYDPRYVFD